MAKTIKFNLKCDNASIRTLDDLREHFCIQDVLNYYKNGLLTRWLDVQGYAEELGKINDIKSSSDEDLVVQISKILNVECDENVIKESLTIIEYEKNNDSIHQKYADGLDKEYDVLKSYQTRYEELLNKIVENNEDYSKIKAATKILIKDFSWMLDLDFENLFYKMKNLAPLALFCFVSFDELRKYYVPELIVAADGRESLDVDVQYGDIEKCRYYENKRRIYNCMCKFLQEESLKCILKDNLKIFSENTDSYWKDIEPDETKRFMILSMGSESRVRALKDKGTELRSGDVNNMFVILKGIDFKNNYNNSLLYMEV